MKRNRVLAVVWLIIAVLLLIALVRGLKDAEPSFNFERSDLETETETYSFGEIEMTDSKTNNLYTYKSPAPKENSFSAAEIESISIELTSIPQKITSPSDGMIHIVFEDKADEYCAFKKTGKKIFVKEKAQKGFLSKSRGCVKIALPENFDGDVSFESVSGSVRVNGLKHDTVSIETVSGAISLSDTQIKELACETVSGAQKISGKYDKVSANSVSGSIEFLDEKPLQSDCMFSSVSGSILLTLVKSCDYMLSYDSTSGSFRDEITGVRGKKSGTSVNGSGKVHIDVTTVSGSIRVQ